MCLALEVKAAKSNAQTELKPSSVMTLGQFLLKFYFWLG